MNNNDTIFALSSGHGKSGVAVVRISGENLGDIFARFVNKNEITPRRAYFTNLRDSAGELIDQCLVIYFPAPHSFTGEDVIELHTHGAPAVISAVFEYLSSLNMRMATPGEFSRRAFYNNKMDLADVDGLAALLDAQTDQQRKHALQSMLGRDSEIYNTWRGSMVEISAFAAAMLDYSPDDLPANIGETIQKRTQKLYDEIGVALQGYRASRAIRGGINVALVGETNVGKSSIFNYMVGSNRAIVSDIAGTTRDVVSSTVDIDGYMVNLADTAGIRETTDEIESIGIERTKNEIENADIVIRVFTHEQQSAKCKVQSANNEIIIINKSDMLSKSELCTLNSENLICVSVHTGDGMDSFMDTLHKKIHEMFDGRESDLSINARTKSLLETAHNELSHAIRAGDNYDIFAEHTRRASDAIGKILGTITANEILDMTFGQLCLGK
ncbi:MAG: tRNA uridine-5-carboxymethylaminomethyl(34) synthesis GTPase MnmE [Alphaproteobacteria bacterium]|nr:tRNA uridine-5-carboxymethylaminomethyl(34) synthesis GTPase MnmE [Alphaproteobacteria bacterium]